MRDPRPAGRRDLSQTESQGGGQRNDRLIAVAAHAQTHQNVQSLKDLRPHLVDEIKEFFIDTTDRAGVSSNRLH